MVLTFETIGNNTFLVYGIRPEDTLDTMTLGMITKNKIPGIAPVLYAQVNRDCFLKYNVTAKITVRKFFSGAVNKHRLLGVFSSITAAVSAAEEYMIDLNSLLLDVDHIYADVSDSHAEVLCLPILNVNNRTDMGTFFKNIMFTTQFDQTENCDYVARIINYLNSSPVFVAEDFGRLIVELKEQSAGAWSHVQVTQAPTRVTNEGNQSRQFNAAQSQALLTRAGEQSTGAQPEGMQLQGNSVEAQSQGDSARKQTQAQSTGVQLQGNSTRMQSEKSMGTQTQESSAGAQFHVPSVHQTYASSRPTHETAVAPKQAAEEKEMSMLYLLQHYNKENVEAYRAQRNARKNAKDGGKKRGKKEGGDAKSASDSKFAVPGQNGGAGIGGFEPQASPQTSVQPSIQRLESQPHISDSMSAYENFGDTVVLGVNDYGEDTVVLGAGSAAALTPYLLRGSNGEKIMLGKGVFRIGKERSYVDYCIGDNATISRSHADIIHKNGQFYIVDNNSTNHTYVNGEMIPSNAEVSLVHGTKIRLSDEEFEFRMF